MLLFKIQEPQMKENMQIQCWQEYKLVHSPLKEM